MKKVRKVLMFVWRDNNDKREFFVLYRKKGDRVVLTGHIGDFIKNETKEEAARREVKEELGIEPLEIENLNYWVKLNFCHQI